MGCVSISTFLHPNAGLRQMRLGWKSLPYNSPMTPKRFVFLAHEFFLQEPHTSAIPSLAGGAAGG